MIHARIAQHLGWSIKDAQSFSLSTLRALVTCENLKAEITRAMEMILVPKNQPTKEPQNPMTFEEWRKQVDREVLALAGVGLDDLPDKNTYDDWEDGLKPLEAAQQYLEEEDFPLEDSE
jgi:hypothetical protein